MVVCAGRLAGGVLDTGVADVDDALLDAVAAAPVGRTAVDGMLVVETATGRVQLDELVAHDACISGRAVW